ncbi:hypothetical protein E1A91_D02G219900v1 [Gossypium mustelinum]|uniref:Uncharacterized protein n=1 Tax=Gossypium mustelinum TaxID=34275 RepID=A0A5D2VZ85_GOSMU|nr:hypothetical protein E1A91_D02G219900v1 [Gossypium mustelinum]
MFYVSIGSLVASFVRTYVCMYVCTCVCMHAWIHASKYVSKCLLHGKELVHHTIRKNKIELQQGLAFCNEGGDGEKNQTRI